MFGGVPLLTQALTAPKTDFTRASIDEVNNQIVADLTFAATNLPDIEDVKAIQKVSCMVVPINLWRCNCWVKCI
jgi:hypothetical protein